MLTEFDMDWARVLELARQYWASAEAFIRDNAELAGAGMVVAVLVAAYLLWRIVRFFIRVAGSLRRAARSAEVRKTAGVGARILIARGRSGREKAICKYMQQALERHFKDFMFGGPYQIVTFPDRVGSDARALRLLARTDADLIVWADMPKTSNKGVRGSVRLTSRSNNPSEPAESSQALGMPRAKSDWTPALARSMAYATAKQYRPALGRPQDFRAERLKPVVEILLGILEKAPKADPKLMAEIADDAASGALQLAASGEADWLDRAVDFTRGTLDGINRGAAPDRWIAAKVNLGRALRLRAERRFDPVVLREATAHLQEALEALRSESRFRLAESAAQAIADAQKLLSGRRKFSITGGGGV